MSLSRTSPQETCALPPAVPLAGALGATVEGFDLAHLDDAGFGRLQALLARYLVLRLPGQSLDPAGLTDLTARFGRPFVHPELPGPPDHPAVMALVKEPGDRAVFGGGDWHADVTYLRPAASVSLLHALEVPAVGGDTLFASQIAAFEALSPGLQAFLRPLRALHSYRAPQGLEEDALSALHPVVRRQPGSGREALYLNRMFTSRFAGWTRAESAPLLQALTGRAVRPEFTCRLTWRAGDLAIWDNRYCLHFPVNDYPGQRRRMIRASALEQESDP